MLVWVKSLSGLATAYNCSNQRKSAVKMIYMHHGLYLGKHNQTYYMEEKGHENSCTCKNASDSSYILSQERAHMPRSEEASLMLDSTIKDDSRSFR